MARKAVLTHFLVAGCAKQLCIKADGSLGCKAWSTCLCGNRVAVVGQNVLKTKKCVKLFK